VAGPATTGAVTTAAAANDPCAGVTLQATDVGVSASTITIEVMADTGSPLAPGLFQGNVDAVKAFAAYVNKHGGIGCRQVVARTWDSHLDPSEAKNGQIDSCQNAVAMVGGNALFNPDVSTLAKCADKTGAATGLPDINALANDINEQCSPQAFTIQAISETCPVTQGQPRPLKEFVGFDKWLVAQNPGLHGLWLIPADLPTTIQSSMGLIAAAKASGITIDAAPKVSGADTQTAYTPRVQIAKQSGATFVDDGSNDVAMIRMRSESQAQGLSAVKVWACSLACYTVNELSQGGSTVNGTYLWMQYLPFEEAATNAQDQAYVSSVSTPDSFGAQAWMAALAFEQAVNSIVKTQGPNAITRANLFSALKSIHNFDADGWMGPKDLQGSNSFSDCMVVIQIQNGKFVRVFPTQPGTLSCDPANVATFTLDPAAEAAKLK